MKIYIDFTTAVHDIEYGFGAHENDTTGIFEVQPKNCPGFTFRKSIFIGTTDLGPRDVRALMEKLAQEYSGNSYHLISKNCNHFCHDVCLKLTGKSIPRWVNRLARLGKKYNIYITHYYVNLTFQMCLLCLNYPSHAFPFLILLDRVRNLMLSLSTTTTTTEPYPTK